MSEFVELMIQRKPFAFSRWGDGEWHSVLGRTEGKNSDGHHYFSNMGEDLRNLLLECPKYMLGMAPRLLQGNHEQWLFKGRIEDWLQEHGLDNLDWIDCDIFYKASSKGILGPVIQAFRLAPAVVLVGPSHLARLKSLLQYSEFITIPSENAYIEKESIISAAIAATESLPVGTIVSISAGMTANLLIDALYKRNGARHIFIDMGSVWDPYAGVKSRKYMRDLDVEPIMAAFGGIPSEDLG